MAYKLSKQVDGVSSHEEMLRSCQVLGITPEDLVEVKRYKKSLVRRQQYRDMPIRQAVERYKSEEIRQLSDRTQLVYAPILDHHCQWLLERHGSEALVSMITEIDIQAYRALRRTYLPGKGHKQTRPETSVAYRNQILGCLKGFYKWLGETRVVQASPATPVKLEKEYRAQPRHLSKEQAIHLLQIARRKKRYALRDYTIVAFMLMVGARIEEVTTVRLGQVNLVKGVVTLEGKGRHRQKKSRLVPLHQELSGILRTWLIEGRGLEIGGDGSIRGPAGWAEKPLFIAPNGSREGKMSIANLRATLNRLFDTLLLEEGRLDASLHRDTAEAKARRRSGSHVLLRSDALHQRNLFTPHSLRHTFAVLALQAGVDLATIQRWLGHEDLGTTAAYVVLRLDEERERMNLHPLARYLCDDGKEGNNEE